MRPARVELASPPLTRHPRPTPAITGPAPPLNGGRQCTERGRGSEADRVGSGALTVELRARRAAQAVYKACRAEGPRYIEELDVVSLLIAQRQN
jgi:hypothetical protein